MDVITWSDDLSVGIQVIDTDHRLLISLVNQLNEAVADEQGHDTVGSVLNALCDYTAYHFGREEMLMEACGYADLEAHKAVHAELRERVSEIRNLYADNPGMVLGEDLMAFLNSWLQEHIRDRDRLYAPCMKGHEQDIDQANRAFADSLSLMDGDAEDDQDFLFY